jgi:hypothetical protein
MSVPQDDLVGRLVTEITDSGAAPLDPLHAAALLEARGWTDQRANEYAFADVFALGSAVYARSSLEDREIGRAAPPEERGMRRALSVMRSYLRGMTFALPMILLSMSVVVLHFSTVSYIRFSTAIATAIGMGTIGSFLVTGGFSQALAHEGLFYISQELYSLAHHYSRRVIASGFLAALIGWILGVLLNEAFQIFPLWMVGVATLFYWLWPMMLSQAVALFVTDVGVFSAAAYYFDRLETHEDTSIALEFRRRWSAILQVIRPYFAYGAIYFAFLFMDRLVAWSAPATYHPYVLWYQNSYELGLDWSLWTFILPMGLIEVYVDTLFRRIEARRHMQTVNDIQAFNSQFVREHRRVTLWVAVTGLLTALVVVLVLQLLSQLGILADPLNDPITRSTFLFAAPSYMLIAVALQNTLVPFSVNMVEGAVRAATWALAVDLVIGFIFSRTIGYQWAVIGLLAGAIMFAVLSVRTARKVIYRLDFNLIRLL